MSRDGATSAGQKRSVVVAIVVPASVVAARVVGFEHPARPRAGHTPEQIARSFDRFWRAGDADHDGTGLGLAIVQHLAEAGGGDVALTSPTAGGLVATVRFSRP